MDKSMNLHFNIYRKEINTWQMTLLFFSFCHVLAPVVKCIRFVQLNEHYWYMNNLSDTCNIVGAWRRVFPSVRGGDWGGSHHYPKNWLVPPCLPAVFPKNVDFVSFMQFLAILRKWSPDKSTSCEKPCDGQSQQSKLLKFFSRLVFVDWVFPSPCFSLKYLKYRKNI